MTVQNFTPQTGVNVTTAAAEHIRRQINKHPGVKGFRIGVKKSGCSGFMYVVDLVKEPAKDDKHFAIGEGVDIFVDAQSLPVINGTELDFVKEGLNYSFRFNNPNSDASCGCGESFSVKTGAN